jgi:hypothetical protein
MLRPSISAASPGHSISARTVGLPPSYRFATRRYIAGGDVRSVATILLESARFQGFLQVLTGNMSDQFIRVRCGIFLLSPGDCQVSVLECVFISLWSVRREAAVHPTAAVRHLRRLAGLPLLVRAPHRRLRSWFCRLFKSQRKAYLYHTSSPKGVIGWWVFA